MNILPTNRPVTDQSLIRPVIEQAVKEYFLRVKSLTRSERKDHAITDQMAIDMILDDLSISHRKMLITRGMIETVFNQEQTKQSERGKK